MAKHVVIGGTGATGSRVALRLASTPGNEVVVVTRDISSPSAVALVRASEGRVTPTPGDLRDMSTIRAAFAGADRVFANTDFDSFMSVTGEYEAGLALLEAARTSGVDRFIWSSLDPAGVLTEGRIPVPHHDSKAAVAAYIALMRSDEMMRRLEGGWYTESVSVLTTGPYMENLQMRLPPRPGPLSDGRTGLTFALPLPGDSRFPLISLDDIAWFATHMFEHWQSWGSRDLAVIADSLTGQEIAAAFEAETGIPSEFVPLDLAIVRDTIPAVGHDLAAMMEFFADQDVMARHRDVALLRRLHPGLMDFRGWLARTRWSGEAGDIRVPVATFG